MIRLGLLAGAAALALTPLAAPAASAAPADHGTATGSAVTPSPSAHHAPAAPDGVHPAATYNNACGAGYGVIDSMPISTLGTVFLTYNGSTHYNCVVTVRNTSGAAVNMAAGMRLSGTTTWHYDGGNYTTYAGPVYLAAGGKCIDWYGIIKDQQAVEYGVHCG